MEHVSFSPTPGHHPWRGPLGNLPFTWIPQGNMWSSQAQRHTGIEHHQQNLGTQVLGSRMASHTCCMHAQSLQSCLILCNPMDCNLPGSSVHGIHQARILEWVAMSSSRGSSQPRGQTHVSYVSCIGRWVLYDWKI